MASLNGQTIASSYEQLLHVDRDGGGNTNTLVSVKDGDNGTTFGIKLATNKVEIIPSAADDAAAFEVSKNDGTPVLTVNTSTLGVTIASTGVNAAPSLAIDNSSNASYIHSAEMFGANLGAGNNNILVIGKSGNAKRSGWMGYKLVSDSESNDNLLVFGHFGTTELMSINGAGDVVIGTANADPHSYNGKTLTLETDGTGDLGNISIAHRQNNSNGDGIGDLIFSNTASSGSEKRAVIIRGLIDGSTANNAGGRLQISTKKDNSTSFNTAVLIDNSGNVKLGSNGMRITMDSDTENANGSSLQRGSLFLNRDDTATIKQINFYKAGSEHSFLETSSTELKIGATGDINLSPGGSNSVYSLGAGGTTNTAFGKGAGSALNGSSNYNVLLGFESGKSMTSANSNVSIGYRAMDAVTSAGNNNVAIGVNVFTNLTGGDENVGIGDSVGLAMTDTSDCVLIGSGAGIAINHTDADGTVAIGQQALNALTEGNKNLAIGFQALHDVAGGDGNMGIGYQAAASIGRTEFDNIAIGTRAMLSLMENASSSSVDNNIAIGVDAMTGGELGSSANFLRNIAIGNNALNSTGSNGNTGLLAIGYDALTANTSGVGNTAIGYLSGQSITTTSQNTLLGYNAGQTLTSNRNTLLGYQAGVSITSGNDNVCVGNAAGDGLQDANGAVIIGHNSDAASGSNYANVIGHNITGGATQRSMIGAGSNFVELDHSTSGNNWANTSDVRIKENIVDSDLGLDFVNKLRAVKYEERPKKDWPQEFLSTSSSEDLEEKNEKVFDGFIAQEVKAIVDESKTTFSAWQIDENNKKQQLQYAMFVVPLVKAVQELSAKVTELESKLGE